MFPLNRMKRRLRDLAIDAYGVAAAFRRELFARRVDPNQVGFQVRHVAIDAMAHHLWAGLRGDFTLAGLMTRKAFLRELSQISLLLVDVMASRAGHLRAGAKTFALAQKRDLIPVNVSAGISFARPGRRIFIQPLAGLI